MSLVLTSINKPKEDVLNNSLITHTFTLECVDKLNQNGHTVSENPKKILWYETFNIPLDNKGRVDREKCLEQITSLPFLSSLNEVIGSNLFTYVASGSDVKNKSESQATFKLITAFGVQSRGEFAVRLKNEVALNAQSTDHLIFVIRKGYFFFDSIDESDLTQHFFNEIVQISYDDKSPIPDEVSHYFGNWNNPNGVKKITILEGFPLSIEDICLLMAYQYGELPDHFLKEIFFISHELVDYAEQINACLLELSKPNPLFEEASQHYSFNLNQMPLLIFENEGDSNNAGLEENMISPLFNELLFRTYHTIHQSPVNRSLPGEKTLFFSIFSEYSPSKKCQFLLQKNGTNALCQKPGHKDNLRDPKPDGKASKHHPLPFVNEKEVGDRKQEVNSRK